MGIEPMSSAWKAEVLPLNYTRRNLEDLNIHRIYRRLILRFLPPYPIACPDQAAWDRAHNWWRGEDSNLRRR